MFIGVLRFVKKMKFLIKDEIRFILYIFLGVFMLYARDLIGQTNGWVAQYSTSVYF